MRNIFILVVFLLINNIASAQKIKAVQHPYAPVWGEEAIFHGAFSDHRIIYRARTDDHGLELWVSDGTDDTSKTKMLKDINVGRQGSLSGAGVKSVFINDKMFFFANEGPSTLGYQLWVTDGTTSGTNRVLSTSRAKKTAVTRYKWIVEYKGKAYFGGYDDTSAGLWVSDGTDAGTQLLVALPDRSSPDNFYITDNKMYFTNHNKFTGSELWVSDGTASGTKMITDLFPGKSSGLEGDESFRRGAALGDNLIFVGKSDSLMGYELFVTDGNTVTLLKEINPKSYARGPWQGFHTFNNKIYFAADDGIHGMELWVTDGTTAGTKMLKDINPGKDSSVALPLASIGDKLILEANDGVHGRELWVTDGTDTGTRMIKDIDKTGTIHHLGAPSRSLHHNRSLNSGFVYDSVYYFTDSDVTHGSELWQTDGTEKGTYMVEDVWTGTSNSIGCLAAQPTTIFVDSNNVWLELNRGKGKGAELHLYQAPPHFPVSVKTIRDDSQFELHPNPNNGNFTVKLDSNGFLNGYLKVTDLTGRVVYDQSIARREREVPLSLPELSKGVYLVTVQLDNRTSTQKIRIE